ncbi:hypothetical protein GCM10010420_04700 [Streptomyces glaucosporus]|uniref:Integral membrane protein n=1 Tax=Streptomyces glaucosporus TaxID=284044 RepID=A0ABP5URU7_9ACTN
MSPGPSPGTPPGSSRAAARRGRVRRAGESAYGMLLLARTALMGAVAAVLLMGGAWTSLDGMRLVTADRGGVRGTLTVEECDGWTCRGVFASEDGAGDASAGTVLETPVHHGAGEELPVVMWPGAGEALRTGAAGVLWAWLPFAGALILASPVIAGGLRMRRTALAAGLLGAVLVGAAFAVL